MSLIGRIPIASELTMTAGRFFLISAPIVGSRLTSHTSPRFGSAELLVNYVATPNTLCFRILPIIGFEFAGLFREQLPSLFPRQFYKRLPFYERKRVLCLQRL